MPTRTELRRRRAWAGPQQRNTARGSAGSGSSGARDRDVPRHTRRLSPWIGLAIVPGLLYLPLGVVGAVLAAWRAPRLRWAFVLVAVGWACAFMLWMPDSVEVVFTPGREQRVTTCAAPLC